jgi:hypothetical protein
MRRLAIILVGLALPGCDSVADVVATHRAGVEEVFRAIAALQPLVDGPDEAPPRQPSPPLVLERAGTTASNAMFIYAQDVPAPGFAQAVHARTLDSVPLLQCGALLSKQALADAPWAPKPSVADFYLRACARLRYVLVIREREYAAPKLDLEARRFAPGKVRASVLAIDVQTRAVLGTFTVSAQNDAAVNLADDEVGPAHAQRLERNLEAAFYDALRAGARRAFPGCLPAGK